jgi:hypothetical protein
MGAKYLACAKDLTILKHGGPALRCGERRKASTATGSWEVTNAALLGVFQVNLFCTVRAVQRC